ncbi:LysR substrate-binding domain-containing protein [Streptomyces europaeiscabiei]|uniref:LysR substrate-binding domain-containing protein n=1 Tax=Streptomyces europaeiscabiei TaxID=146819 RepID=UPI0038F73914
MELTPAGEAFLVEARRILAIAEAAPNLAQRIHSGSRGVVRLGFTAASTFGTLGHLLNRLEQQLPDVRIELYEMVTREQIAALASEDLHLGLARPPFDSELFDSRLLHREALLLAVPAEHRLVDLDRPVEAEDLTGEPLIFHSQQKARYFYDLMVSMVPLAQERVVHSVSQVLTMLWLVAADRGVAFVPASAKLLHIPNVAFVPLATHIPEPVELHLLWPRHSRNPALARALVALEAISP